MSLTPRNPSHEKNSARKHHETKRSHKNRRNPLPSLRILWHEFILILWTNQRQRPNALWRPNPRSNLPSLARPLLHAQTRFFPPRFKTRKHPNPNNKPIPYPIISAENRRSRSSPWNSKQTTIHRIRSNKMVQSTRNSIAFHSLQFTCRYICNGLYHGWTVH